MLSREQIESLHSWDVAILLGSFLLSGNAYAFQAMVYKYLVEPKDTDHKGFLYVRQIDKPYGVAASENLDDYEFKPGLGEWMRWSEYYRWWTDIALVNSIRARTQKSLIDSVVALTTPEKDTEPAVVLQKLEKAVSNNFEQRKTLSGWKSGSNTASAFDA